MTSPLDAPLRAIGATLLKQFGAEGEIEYVATGSYNPTTGKASGTIDKTATVKGVVENYSSSEIDGTLVLRGDLKWTIAAKGITAPRVNDLVTIDGTRYTTISVESVWSGQQRALLQLQLRA